MTALTRFSVFLAFVVLGASVGRGGHPHGLAADCACPSKRCCCPDDYCRKLMPCVVCLPNCCERDCYDCKRLPCVPCIHGCECDDYCGKPSPCITPLCRLSGVCVPYCVPHVSPFTHAETVRA